MTIARANEPTPRKPLRLWPGVVLPGNVLLVRNGEETAAFRLASAGR
jgi:hypothetical protein